MFHHILKKIYPKPKNNNYDNLSYDTEGLYSITHPNDAEQISKQILKICNTTNIKIIDTTAGCGGNLISFCKYFDNVTGIEISKTRFDILNKNLECYNYQNTKIKLINDNCLKYFKNDYDVFFIDPPWGGPKYKKNENLKLYLDDVEISSILLRIPKNKLVVLKIPYNYKYDYIINKYKLEHVMKLKNILILYFYI